MIIVWHEARREIATVRKLFHTRLRLCDCAMPKPSVVMPQWMLDEIDDRRHSRTDRSEWVREAVVARLNAEDRGEWDEIAPDGEKQAPEAETAD